MDNSWINIRFGARHFQITTRPFKIRLVVNDYWKYGIIEKWFEVYTLFGKHY